MIILGIETSCDETAAAVVEDGCKILSSTVSSSVNLHAAYGGIVPEIAARSHVEVIIPVIYQALADASVDWEQIDAIAVTNRPGLIGSLLIGVMTARTLAITKQKPLHAVNHVLAHTYATFLTDKTNSPKLKGYRLAKKSPEFPFISMVASGGHTQLMLYKSHRDYRVLGQTQDDAAGEAFDKVAKILGLPYPGGPSIDDAAVKGNPASVKLPKARMENPYDFSFSGLKTAVLRAAQQMAGHDFTFPSARLPKELSSRQKADLAASFQRTAVDTLADAADAAVKEYRPKTFVLAGGVAANQTLRKALESRLNAPLLLPDIKLCTDNGAMIAAAAYYQHEPADNSLKLTIIPSL